MVALSSAEAELGGICKAAAEGLGLESLFSDLGRRMSLSIHCDSSAATEICKRRGLGKVRHFATSDMWIQDRLAAGDFALHMVKGSDNPSDMLTKPVDRGTLQRHTAASNLVEETGRAGSASRIVE